jgi:hypothetical protein
MSHDKTKAAARRRMTATGEPYTAARRQAISDHNVAHGTSAVSAEDVQAAAAVHQELGPDYSDAVLAAFIDRVDRAVDARVAARLADGARSDPAAPARRSQRRLTRRVARDVLAASAGALVAVGAIGLHDITSTHQTPVRTVAIGARSVRTPSRVLCVLRPHPTKTYVFTVGGQVTVIQNACADVPPGS